MFSNSKRESAMADGFMPNAHIPQNSPFHGGQTATVIARGVKVEGEFHSQGDVIIEGDVRGTIFAAGTLTIGADANIVANITAQEAVISGSVTGNLQIEKQAIFHATAHIVGDLIAERITVEAGAVIDGKVQIGVGMAKPVSVREAEVEPSVSAPSPSELGEEKKEEDSSQG